MTLQHLLKWLRALLQPAPMLGLAMIAVLWLGLIYLLSDHHGTLANPAERQPIFLPIVIALTFLELVTMAASIRRHRSLEQTNIRFNTALENMTHGLCMFDGNKRLVIFNDRYASLYRLPR
jgi:PAS domain-containing protein